MNGNFLSLANIITKENSVIKISDFEFFEPSFLLGILSLQKSGKINIDCNTNMIEIKNYLNRINFFRYLGISSTSINRNSSNNIVEITQITKATSGPETTEIAKKILQNIGISFEIGNKFLYGTLEWIFRELIDNTIQHSKANLNSGGSYFMLQSYPNRGELHICIVDNGIGIKESFRDSIYWNEEKKDEYYIDLAFQRGKTSNSDIGAGNGLYWTKEIVKKQTQN